MRGLEVYSDKIVVVELSEEKREEGGGRRGEGGGRREEGGGMISFRGVFFWFFHSRSEEQACFLQRCAACLPFV